MTSPTSRSFAQILFHPFVRIAGATSLMLGLLFIALAGWIGSLRGLHFDGVLDAHVGASLPMWFSLSEGILDWLTLSMVLYLVGRLLSRTDFRAVDLFGTQALARWPMILVSLACFAPGFHRFTAALMKSLQTVAAAPEKLALPPLNADAVVFGLVTLLMLICTVWMVALMWKSFSHCCNLRGGKAGAGFVVGLLVAEVLSKVLIVQLLKAF